MNYLEVFKILAANKNGRNYPNRSDSRYSENFITPSFIPKFGIDIAFVGPVFTIGSCFARNIEAVLEPMGVVLPTKRFAVPKEEWTHGSNGLLNEFNPGSISQKIISTSKRNSS